MQNVSFSSQHERLLARVHMICTTDTDSPGEVLGWKLSVKTFTQATSCKTSKQIYET